MLNKQLFDALNKKFKNSGGVRIVNEGVQNQWQRVWKHGKWRREIITHGENYFVNCPYCNDTRCRCYINYEFGTVADDGSLNLNLIKCFNEECFIYVPERRNIFFMEVLFGRPVSKAAIKQGVIRDPGEYVSPGETIPLHKLDLSHPAVTYLRGRGFNPSILSLVHKLSWCTVSDFKYAQSRIIIPVVENGKECGWLARIAQDGDFYDSAGKKIPKYYNSRGFSSSRHLYNFDRAKHYRTIILVEGAFDALKVGPPAMALFGKSISSYNVEKLASVVRRNDALVVVALDPDKSKTDRSARHHIEVAVNKIKYSHTKVMPFYLPSGTDPAKLTREQFWQLLYAAASVQGFTLDFSTVN